MGLTVNQSGGKGVRFGAIDIGSNAIRILFQEVYETPKGAIFKKLSLIRLPVRLGEDSFVRGVISEKKKEHLINMAMAFRHLCAIFEVDDHQATATSAMRDAQNGMEIIRRIKDDIGLDIAIIPGEEEAKILYESVFNTGKLENSGTYMFIDVGGGSTEINFFVRGERKDWESFNIGTVRLKENIQDEREWDRFDQWIQEKAGVYQPDYAIGTGGNINKFYKLCGLKDWELLQRSMLEEKIEFLKQFTEDEMIQNFDIKSDRADVIIPGGSIYNRAMKQANLEEMIVPKVGLPDGLIRRMYLTTKGEW